MLYDAEGHPDTTLSDWQNFRKWNTLYPFADVIDRSKIDLVDWFVPLARGVAVAGNALLRKAGHVGRKHRPPGWKSEPWLEIYQRTGAPLLKSNTGAGGTLTVARCGHLLWTIERWTPSGSLSPSRKEILVYSFGSTPLVARSCWDAMRIAEYCHVNHVPGLRWVSAYPKDKDGAIEFAKTRPY